MGSRGYRRLCRRARAEIRRARREAMIGACNDVVAHLREQIERNVERETYRQLFPGLEGLMPMDLVWPEPLNALHPPLVRGNGLYVGTIGGRPRVDVLINPLALGVLGGERKTTIEFDALMHRPQSHGVVRIP